MKKNRLFMLGIVAVFVGILSLTLVSSTFAKYTTSGNSANTTASVAKWGVQITANSDKLFEKEYDTDDSNVKSSIASSVSATTETLAPGTKNDDVLLFSISGKPEVAVKVSYTCIVTLTNWKIGDSNEFYCPLKFTITTSTGTISVNATSDSNNTADAFAESIKNAIESASYTFDANTDLSQQDNIGLKIAWEWSFEGDGTEDAYQTDKKDTALADKESLPKIEIKVTATVEQID